MNIFEDESRYTLEDVFDQINEDFGFSYIKSAKDRGYILLGGKVRLNLSFDLDNRKISSAVIVFPDKEVDITKNRIGSDLYLNSIESAGQIIDLINRMLDDKSQDNYVLEESNDTSLIQDITGYLLSGNLRDYLNEINFTNLDSKEVSQLIVDKCVEQFDNTQLPKVSQVTVMKVDGNDYSTPITSDHYVVEYNNKYYDYRADEFKEAFKINKLQLPVIQPTISSSQLINSTASSVKGYVLLAYDK